MLKETLKKLETPGDIDAMVRGKISIQWASKEKVEALTEDEYLEYEQAILSDSRLFAQRPFAPNPADK